MVQFLPIPFEHFLVGSVFFAIMTVPEKMASFLSGLLGWLGGFLSRK